MSEITFERELENLNTEQRQAVDHIYGPVMVIAGPGTGKTQILAMRIGNVLQQTDTDPRNILCLTYTEAGTVAMRKRLTKLIGPEAYNVNIHTFHGFCNKIIKENAEMFSEHEDLRPVDDLERLDFYIQLIDNWPVEHPLKKLKGDPYIAMSSLKELFNLMKSEGWSSTYIIQRVDQYISELPTREGFYYKRANKVKGIEKGDPHHGNIEKQIKKLDRLKAAAFAFDEFSELMAAGGRYDYADMILWVLNALNTNEDLLFNIQEQYQFILVDEYQDTNGAQNDLLFHICGELVDQPNIFVVGDDDQAIFRFQGANLSNILDFKDRLSDDLFTVVLKNNYRSSSDILIAADALIDHNNERLTKENSSLDKKLIAAGALNSTFEGGVLIGDFESETEELLGIQYYVESLLSAGVAAKEIAILFRKRSHVQPLIKYFIAERIAHDVKKINNILTDGFISKLITILRYIQDEIESPFTSDLSLFEILHYPWFHIPPLDIAHISVALRKEKNKNWRSHLANVEFIKARPLQAPERLLSASSLLEDWIKSGINDTLQTLFETIMYSKPIFNFILSSGEAFHYLKTANTFFTFIKDQTDKQETLELADFLSTIDKMSHYEIALPMMKIDKTGDGIQLMTAHGSKGLEFEHVIIIGCNSKKWEEAASPPPKFTYPDTLIPTNTENKLEDTRRLFYVGMTRAKKEVLMTYSRDLLSGKTAAPSRFIIEVEESFVSQKWHHASSVAEKEKFLFSQYAPTPVSEENFPPQIDEILQSMTLNISAVNKYLRCPLSYYYENVLRAPMARTAPMGYGNAIHEALERAFRHDENEEGKFPSLDTLHFYFKKGMERFHAHFTPKEYESHMANGFIKLTGYYTHHIEEWKTLVNSKAEHHVSNAHVEGIPVSGIFDRIDFINNQLVVVDYKTGNSFYGTKKMKGPEQDIDEVLLKLNVEKNPEERDKLRLRIEGGDYWRQIVFYKLLARADTSFHQPFHKAYVSFVESDDNIKLYRKEIDISASDEEVVRNQLKSTFQKIQNKEFNRGCALPNCRWCAMIAEVAS